MITTCRSNVNDKWYQFQHFLQFIGQLLSASLEIFLLTVLALAQIVQPVLRLRVVTLTSVRARRAIQGRVYGTTAAHRILGWKNSEFVSNYVTQQRAERGEFPRTDYFRIRLHRSSVLSDHSSLQCTILGHIAINTFAAGDFSTDLKLDAAHNLQQSVAGCYKVLALK